MARLFAPMEGGPKTLRIIASTTWICPPGTTLISVAEGAGARGRDAETGSGEIVGWYEVNTVYGYLRSNGARVIISSTERYVAYTGQAGYCNPRQATSSATYSHTEVCVGYDRPVFSGGDSPATTGASSRGFDKVFPGSYQNTPVVPTTFTNIAVVPGRGYPITIASGGYIAITYIE